MLQQEHLAQTAAPQSDGALAPAPAQSSGVATDRPKGPAADRTQSWITRLNLGLDPSDRPTAQHGKPARNPAKGNSCLCTFAYGTFYQRILGFSAHEPRVGRVRCLF